MAEPRYFALARFSTATPEAVHNPSFERVLIPVISHTPAITAIVFLFLAAPLNIYSAYHRVNFGGHAGGPCLSLAAFTVSTFSDRLDLVVCLT